MQRTERKARGARGVGRVGEGLRLLGIDLREGVQLAIGPFDAGKEGVDDLARGEFPGGEACAQFRKGEVVKIGHQ